MRLAEPLRSVDEISQRQRRCYLVHQEFVDDDGKMEDVVEKVNGMKSPRSN